MNKLAEENEMLRERLRLLEAALVGDEPGWHLVSKRLRFTPHQTTILRVLYRREIATFEQILMALYSARPDAEIPGIKIINVHVCHMRKKLGTGSIYSMWGRGYYLAREFKELISGWLREAERGRVGAFEGDKHGGISQGRSASAGC